MTTKNRTWTTTWTTNNKKQ